MTESRRVGPYKLLRQLGQGGMGTVYLGQTDEDERPVALKLLSGALLDDPEFVERFRREAGITAQFDHPNLVRLLDYGQDDTSGCFLVMDYVPGKTLREHLNESGPLPVGQALGLFRQVLGAVAYAHERGIVHRDLKPENLLLDPAGRLVVADFGIARLEKSTRLTRTGLMAGTPEYMSPEQLDGKQVGPASDIYSLGLILYEMLTGVTPFHTDSLAELIQRQCFQPAPPPSFQRSELSPDLDRLVLKALEKNPERRFADVQQFEEALLALEQPVKTRSSRSLARPVTPVHNEMTLRVNVGTRLQRGRQGWAWICALLLLGYLSTAALALHWSRQLPQWYQDGLGAEPAVVKARLYGALTLNGCEVALFADSRTQTGLEQARAASNRWAVAVREHESPATSLEGRERDQDYEIVLKDDQVVLVRVTPELAAGFGLKPQDVGPYWLALMKDHLALRSGSEPRYTEEYEREHPLRPKDERPIGPLLRRLYQRGRHSSREGALEERLLLQARRSLAAEDRTSLREAARSIPRALPKRGK